MEFDELENLLKLNRSYRRFDQSVKINRETLKHLAGLSRFCASGRNLQPLKYRLVFKEECAAIFKTLAWAGYFTDWDGPAEGERPTAYLVQCLDKSLTSNCLCDDGLQLEAITLGAVSLGLGCCIIKSFKAKELTEILHLPNNFDARYVLAIGKPAETVVLEDMGSTSEASIKYYRDENCIHHVPKRPLEHLLI